MKNILLVATLSCIFSFCYKSPEVEQPTSKISTASSALLSTFTDTLRPAGAGDSTNNVTNSTSNWFSVSDITQDGDATIIKNSSGSYLSDLYTIQGNSIPDGATINNVTVFFVSRSVATQRPPVYTTYAKPCIKENSVFSQGNEVIPSATAYSLYSTEWDTRPSDGSAWTISDINNLQVGVSQRALAYNLNSPRTTQVYVVVNYSY